MGKKHVQNCKMLSRQVSVLDMPSVSSKQIMGKQVKEGEVRLASFICEHDIPIRVVEHMPQLLQTICPDSQIAKQIKCGRTKLTSLINNVTGRESSKQLITHLQSSKFSLIVDESTDKGCIKHLCMVARTLVDDEVKDCFLGLIQLEDATAIALYNNVVSFFRDNQIDYKQNMIGFAADGANAMLGAHNSLSSRLKNDVDGLFIMKCICHTFALCASYACLKLPRSIEDLARDIFSFIQCSPKRIGSLKEFQAFVNVKPHKLLHPSQTRWLSLHMVVSRLLEQYDALTLYFTEAAFTESLHACQNILEKLKHPLTKLYFLFLDFVLPYFNSLNKLMQSEWLALRTISMKIAGMNSEVTD
ncbi:uncharacterized protein LOC126999147 [Eriocheir sinensis]|uniref:uncharacterized protein LOC126999147 n=1 Tax=Eriocheir sinensis TaxID=95602 RepID=UPI0021C62B91|nr:uncharacterized protein LOC126999147 [Eriocheir sinensis]